MKLKLKIGKNFTLNLPPKPQVTRNMQNEVFTVLHNIVESKWVDVLVRNLQKPNPPEAPLHCHGVEMLTLCLKGGYDDRFSDGTERQVRPGKITHFKPETYHTAHTIHGDTGAWTLGVNLRWRGLRSAGYLVDGKFQSMPDYIESTGVPKEIVEQVRKLTEGEQSRRSGKKKAPLLQINDWTFLCPAEPVLNIAGSTMMVLYPLVRTPKWAVVVRKILMANVEDHLHTHGFPYLTFILKGGYVEVRDDNGSGIHVRKTRKRFDFNWMPDTVAHRIEKVFGTTWTLGFHLKWKASPERPTVMHVDGGRMPCDIYYREYRRDKVSA